MELTHGYGYTCDNRSLQFPRDQVLYVTFVLDRSTHHSKGLFSLHPTPFHYTDPQLKLYQNSQEIDQYTGDRSHAHLTEYVQDKSRVFARSLAQNVLVESGREKATSGVNAEGISVNAGEEELDRMIKDGPVFVKFYAPWCGQ